MRADGDRKTRGLKRLALGSAVLMTLAFQPADIGLLAWVALAPLLYALPEARRTRHAFFLGYLFGLLHWGACTPWIGVTVVDWAGTPLGWLAWLVLALIESLWYGLFGGLAWWVARRRRPGPARVLAVAALWVVVEYLRAQGSLAMPWLFIGYTQHRYLPLLQSAGLWGVYGLSFALALSGAGLAEAVRGGNRRARALCLAPGAALAAAMLLYGAVRLRQPDTGPEVRVAVMQPNIRSGRTDAPPVDATMDIYAGMLADAQRHAGGPRPIDLVVWPESAAPSDAVNDAFVRRSFGLMAYTSGAYQVAGTGYEDEQGREFSSAALFAPEGTLSDRYDKQWLVPFGEWIPARRWLPFGDLFHFPSRDACAGTRNTPLPAGSMRLSVLVCYESVFPAMARARVAAGANLLTAITNDSWAGVSPEQAQHTAMTVLRAVETHRYVAAAASTGVTGLIDPCGRFVSAPPYQRTSLVGTARLRTDISPYVRYGDWLVALCGLGVLGALLIRKAAN